MFRILIAAAVLAVASGQFCQICGAGKVITLPEAVYTPPGRDPVACGVLQTTGINGDAELFQNCAFLPGVIGTICGCADGTFAPTTAPDTEAPAAPMEAPVAPVEAPVAPVEAPVGSEAPAGSEQPVTPAPVTPEPTPEPTAPPTAPPTASPTKAPTLAGTTVVGMKMKMNMEMMKKKKAMMEKKQKLVKQGMM